MSGYLFLCQFSRLIPWRSTNANHPILMNIYKFMVEATDENEAMNAAADTRIDQEERMYLVAEGPDLER